MYRPTLIILGIGIIAGAAIGFLSYSFDPFTASQGIKFLFLASVCIAIISASSLVIYAVSVAWHEGGRYFMAKYLGAEADYFRPAFRRGIFVGILAMVLFGLRQHGSFTRYFAGGAALILLIIELLLSAHDQHTKTAKF